MSDESYNGYTNYETWLLCLNIDNDEGLYDEIRNIALSYPKKTSAYEVGMAIKEELESLFWDQDNHIYKICDSWTQRDWDEIDWAEVATTRTEE